MKVLISSSYVNAYSLWVGLKRLLISGYTVDPCPTFPIPSVDILENIDYFFFTEEASLRKALSGDFAGRFLPTKFPMELLDDKWAFTNWLDWNLSCIKGLKQWSFEDIDLVEYPCLLKAKHSWVGEQKLPRGWLCNDRDDLVGAVQSLRSKGFKADDFFLQKWLGYEDCRVISVCGFHDSENHARNLVAVVERIASHTQGLSCSAAVETISDEWGLVRSSEKILDALDFVGPYELEFLVVGATWYVLELNPRFWMQHALFLPSGNGLIKRYIGLDDEHDRKIKRISGMVWVDGLHLIKAVLTFDLSFIDLVARKLFLVKKKKVLVWPSLPMAVYVWLRIIRRKIVGKLHYEIRIGM
jgi:hypothetical protein